MSNLDPKELSPGRVLKALREERNLTLKDVHERTRVSIKKLSLIEADAYSQFEAPVFVRGYIRSYARFVGGDGNNLVRLYDQTFVESDERPLADQHAQSDSLGSGERFLENFSKNFINKTSIGSVVGVLAALWLVSMLIFGGDSEPETGHSLSDQAASADAVLASPGDEDVSMVNTDASTDDQPLTSVSSEKADASLVSDVQETLAASEDTMRSAQPDEPSAAAGQTQAVSDAPSAQIEETTVESFLGFQFTDECWVEVRDAFDNVIFADIKNKGDNLRLSGVAPFDIMLGNARATELTVDGEPVELRVSGNRKTLRLTVFAK